MPLIEDHALLGDLRTAALVTRDGDLDWLCLPRFDSPACFAALLGGPEHGHWRLDVPDGPDVERTWRYRPGSLVLEREVSTPDGRVRFTDAMTPSDASHDVVRVVESLDGEPEVEMELRIRFGTGRDVPWVRKVDDIGGEAPGADGLIAVAGPDAVVLRGDVLPDATGTGDDRRHLLRLRVPAGRRMVWTLRWFPSHEALAPPIDGPGAVEATDEMWGDFTSRCTYDGRHAELVRRSLVTLKALTYAPSGGIVAAPTTSLPETFGGSRNWDYRYCWLRDATLTLWALLECGYREEAEEWRAWLLRAIAGDPEDLQIMYGITGERDLVERELDWLPGYEGSSPVRVGNAASDQLQVDVYGEVLHALFEARRAGVPDSPDAWQLQLAVLDWLETGWRRPDSGLWEVRGPDRHFTHSKVMAWVGFDRAVRAVEEQGLTGPVERWREVRDEIHAEVLERAWSEELGAFTQFYDGDTLDAAVLVMPLFGFLPADDPRFVSTVEAIGRDVADGGLRHGGLVTRYATGDGPHEVDGLEGEEAVFLPCSFWYVEALALAGRVEEAEAELEGLLDLANDLGLLAEGWEPRAGRQAGNFPQAFTHVGLVTAVLTVERARRVGRVPSSDQGEGADKT